MEYEAGFELDELVAVKIMELPKAKLGGTCPKCHGETRLGQDRAWCYQCSEWIYSPYPEYSTDIVAAWQVVEKMRGRFHIVTLSSDKSLGAREWHFHLANYPYPHDKRNEFNGFSDTAPLAICRTVMEIDDAAA